MDSVYVGFLVGGIIFTFAFTLLNFFVICGISDEQGEIKTGVDKIVKRLERTFEGLHREAERAAETAIRRVRREDQGDYSIQQESPVYEAYRGSARGTAATTTYPHELERIYTQELRRYYDHGVHARPEPVAYQDRGPEVAEQNHQGFQNYGTAGLGNDWGNVAQSNAGPQITGYGNIYPNYQIAGREVSTMPYDSTTSVDVENSAL